MNREGRGDKGSSAEAQPLRGTALKRFNRERRRERDARRRVAFVLENVGFAVNVGSIFRIADACDADMVALAGATPGPDDSGTVQKVGRGKHLRVPWARYESASDALDRLEADGFQPIAVEITADAKAHHQFHFPERSALVLGSEDHGVTRTTLARCPDRVYIPMLGKGGSLNVHVAAAIVAYQALLTTSKRDADQGRVQP